MFIEAEEENLEQGQQLVISARLVQLNIDCVHPQHNLIIAVRSLLSKHNTSCQVNI